MQVQRRALPPVQPAFDLAFNFLERPGPIASVDGLLALPESSTCQQSVEKWDFAVDLLNMPTTSLGSHQNQLPLIFKPLCEQQYCNFAAYTSMVTASSRFFACGQNPCYPLGSAFRRDAGLQSPLPAAYCSSTVAVGTKYRRGVVPCSTRKESICTNITATALEVVFCFFLFRFVADYHYVSDH